MSYKRNLTVYKHLRLASLAWHKHHCDSSKLCVTMVSSFLLPRNIHLLKMAFSFFIPTNRPSQINTNRLYRSWSRSHTFPGEAGNPIFCQVLFLSTSHKPSWKKGPESKFMVWGKEKSLVPWMVANGRPQRVWGISLWPWSPLCSVTYNSQPAGQAQSGGQWSYSPRTQLQGRKAGAWGWEEEFQRPTGRPSRRGRLWLWITPFFALFCFTRLA